MKIFFKSLGILMALLFAWAAIVQQNDPDALRWYGIYGLAALASLLFAFNKLKFSWALFLSGFYIGFSIYSWPEKFEGVTIGSGNIDNIEKGREALGMLIAAVIMVVYALRIRKKTI